MKEIIETAIEGGWKFHGDTPIYNDNMDQWAVTDGNGGYIIPNIKEFVLDPLFWQALGKVADKESGWQQDVYKYPLNDSLAPEWLVEALRFYEKNLTEGWDAAVKYLATRVPTTRGTALVN